jgi:HSP20 family protein
MKNFIKSLGLKKKENITEKVSEKNEKNSIDSQKDWLSGGLEEEGQLSIDVFQTADKLVIVSTIAGVKPEDIDITINNDMLTIRGKRERRKEIKDEDYLYSECYWGSFSRSIILPVEIEMEKINAVIENGVLTVTLPKAKVTKKISIKVKEK